MNTKEVYTVRELLSLDEEYDSLPCIYIGENHEMERQNYVIRKCHTPYARVVLRYEHSIFTKVRLAGRYMCIGFSNCFCFLSMDDLSVSRYMIDSYFGALYQQNTLLLATSASELFCFNDNAELLWKREQLGVDGIVVDDISDSFIYISGEWDPPGGWERKVLDRVTGEDIDGL